MDEQGMRARIQQLIEHQHMNRQSFAEHIGVSPASLSQILNDKQKPTLAIVIAITNRFPALRYDWLLDGKEPMFTDGTTSDKNSPTPSQQEGATPPSSNPISAQSQPDSHLLRRPDVGELCPQKIARQASARGKTPQNGLL